MFKINNKNTLCLSPDKMIIMADCAKNRQTWYLGYYTVEQVICRFCQRVGPDVTTAGNMKVAFFSDRKHNAPGAECVAECVAAPITIAAPPPQGYNFPPIEYIFCCCRVWLHWPHNYRHAVQQPIFWPVGWSGLFCLRDSELQVLWICRLCSHSLLDIYCRNISIGLVYCHSSFTGITSGKSFWSLVLRGTKPLWNMFTLGAIFSFPSQYYRKDSLKMNIMIFTQ